MTGDPIDAQTALAWGLVNRVVPRARLVAETQALARAASRGSLASKALGKRTFREQVGLDIEAAYAEAVEVMAQSAVSADGREAMRAFVEKRPAVYPRWRASEVSAYSLRISSKKPTYDAGIERGVRPIGV